MPPKSLNKVQKSIGKKSGAKKGLHVNSRDAHRLQRAGDRDARVAKTEKIRKQQHMPYQNRVAHCQEYVGNKTEPLSMDEAQAMIQGYVERNDEEAAELKEQRRPGRPGSSREAAIEMARATEVQEFKSGFWLPDVFDGQNLEKLKAWDGQWTSLALLKFVRLDSDGTVTESAFPPRKG